MADTAPPPLTRAELFRGLEVYGRFCANNDDFTEWYDFVVDNGPELIALSLAALGRLEPRRAGTTYVKHKLGATQQRIVDTVREGPLTTTEIAFSIGVNYQNVRRMLPVLAGRGLIVSGHDPIRAATVWVASEASSLLPQPSCEPDEPSEKHSALVQGSSVEDNREPHAPSAPQQGVDTPGNSQERPAGNVEKPQCAPLDYGSLPVAARTLDQTRPTQKRPGRPPRARLPTAPVAAATATVRELVPVERITSGDDLFFCAPYACKLLARACVERQARFAAGDDKTALRLCGGCELGHQVKERSGVVIDLATITKRRRGW